MGGEIFKNLQSGRPSYLMPKSTKDQGPGGSISGGGSSPKYSNITNIIKSLPKLQKPIKAMECWNDLSTEVKHTTSIKAFKCLI